MSYSYPAKVATPRSKARAQDMDESLELTVQMKEHIENLTARQAEAIKKMRDSKNHVQKLRDQVQAMQQQIDSVHSERGASTRATEEMKSDMEKLENDHAVLHSTHTWTKSSLDAALAAQEEYRKGYNSLRAAFKKAKEELEVANAELANAQDTHHELERARAVLDERKAHWKKELDSVDATMQRIARRHKDKAKSVLDRMHQGQASGLLGTCFVAWLDFLKDWKNNEHMRLEVEAAQAKLAGFQSSKREKAKAFLDRMTASSNTGLVSVSFKYWVEACADALKDRHQADETATKLRNQKLEARKRLEATLGENMKGIKGLTFKNWLQTIREEKEEREIKAQADAVLKDYQRRKKYQSYQVVNRMATKKENGLLSQVTLLWKIIITSEVAARIRDEESKARLKTIFKDIEEAKQILADKKSVLVDAQEELAEVKKKNKTMKSQLQQIMDLEDSMEVVQKEFMEVL
uniref:Uncharacterized protein n=1 Tax=Alexandrium monilatum TaxID=311494 RepID=A0A7S4Q4C8_9DINO